MMSPAVRMLMRNPLRPSQTPLLLSVAYRGGLAALISLAMMACDDTSGQLQVELCGDVLIPQDVDSVRVSILDHERQEVRAGVQELVDCPNMRALPITQRINFSAYDDTELWVVAQGLRQGVEIMRFERRYRPNQEDQPDGPITLGLTRACLGVFCPLGQTCVQGRCELAPFTDPSSLCKSSVTPDGADMGMMPDQGPAPEASDMGQGGDMGMIATPISSFCEQNQEQP